MDNYLKEKNYLLNKFEELVSQKNLNIAEFKLA
jgi:hypothetical protein